MKLTPIKLALIGVSVFTLAIGSVFAYKHFSVTPEERAAREFKKAIDDMDKGLESYRESVKEETEDEVEETDEDPSVSAKLKEKAKLTKKIQKIEDSIPEGKSKYDDEYTKECDEIVNLYNQISVIDAEIEELRGE